MSSFGLAWWETSKPELRHMGKKTYYSHRLNGRLSRVGATRLSILAISVAITWILFEVFPAIPNAPNIATVFVSVFGTITGAIGICRYLDEN
jgi:hypothetical protein